MKWGTTQPVKVEEVWGVWILTAPYGGATLQGGSSVPGLAQMSVKLAWQGWVCRGNVGLSWTGRHRNEVFYLKRMVTLYWQDLNSRVKSGKAYWVFLFNDTTFTFRFTAVQFLHIKNKYSLKLFSRQMIQTSWEREYLCSFLSFRSKCFPTSFSKHENSQPTFPPGHIIMITFAFHCFLLTYLQQQPL